MPRFIFGLVAILFLLPMSVSADWFGFSPPDIQDREKSVTFEFVLINDGQCELRNVPVLLPYKVYKDGTEEVFAKERQVEYIDILSAGQTMKFNSTKLNLTMPEGRYTVKLGTVRIGGRMKRKEKDLQDNVKLGSFYVCNSYQQSYVKRVRKEKQKAHVIKQAPKVSANSLKDLEALRKRAHAFFSSQKYAQADVLYKRIVSLADITIGRLHSFTLKVLGEVADMHRRWYVKNGGKAIFLDYISRLQEKHGKDCPETIEPYGQLASYVIWIHADYTLGEQCFEKSIELMKKHGRYKGSYTHLLLSEYCEIGLRAGWTKKALYLCEEAVQLMEKYAATDERRWQDFYVDCAIKSIRLYCVDQGLSYLEHPLYKRAIVFREIKRDPDDRFTQLHNEVGNLIQVDRKAAYELGKKALKEAEQYYGVGHSKAVRFYHNLGLCAEYMGKIDEAGKWRKLRWEYTCSKESKANASSRISALNSLARHYEIYDRTNTAIEGLRKRLLVLTEKRMGPHHLDTGFALQKLAFVYRRKSENQKAIRYFERALAIFVESKGSKGVPTNFVLKELVKLYRHQGNETEAIKYEKRIVTTD